MTTTPTSHVNWSTAHPTIEELREMLRQIPLVSERRALAAVKRHARRSGNQVGKRRQPAREWLPPHRGAHGVTKWSVEVTL